MTESRNVQIAFVILVVSIFLILDISLASFVIDWSRMTSVTMFVFLVFFNFSFSLLLSKRILSFVVKPFQLPRLQNLVNSPKVAVLYATMNDLVPECLCAISQTYPCDVYVLDDSTDQTKKDAVDRIAKEKGFKVLRREYRRGFKAGAINDWMKTCGATYDYVVLLDADSYLPSDWIENALKYSEHPSNANISIFQGLINLWNLDNRFIRTLAPMHVLGQDVWEKRLANHLDAVFCYGHNVLLRMRHLTEIGGFVEGYVSEDFATAVELAKRGYRSTFIPIHTYEAMPENIRGFIKRQNKWTRGSMEFFSFVRKPNLSFLQRLFLFETPLGHLANIVIMITIFLTIFGYYSTTAHLMAFAANLLDSRFLYILSIPLFQYVIVTSIVSGVLLWTKLYQLKVSGSALVKYQLLSKAIGAIMLPYEVKTTAKYLVSTTLTFPVTPKGEKTLSFKETLSISKATLLIVVLLIFGLMWANPLGIFYNITWLVPFFVSPLVIYFFSKTHNQAALESQRDFGGTTANCGSATMTITCLRSQPRIVHGFLDHVRASC